eukprot:CAMPEP_0172811508 /NCGR_PEP_ID=MMETSP1075-20121228/9457_1 /TAXON_ID=2916 /ORGANISM="Ceratium fusus, Strain PA161109" /LENGTH=136 /DNA_ID=CAMNT_0013650939 /DNA_START=41 /DNA_END=451 /DNA_ORIENTATION=+
MATGVPLCYSHHKPSCLSQGFAIVFVLLVIVILRIEAPGYSWASRPQVRIWPSQGQGRRASVVVFGVPEMLEESGLPSIEGNALSTPKASDTDVKEETRKGPSAEDRTFSNPIIRFAVAISAGLVLNIIVRTQLGW